MKLSPICILLLTIGCTTAQIPVGTTELDTTHAVITSPDKPVRVSGGVVAGSILTKATPFIPEEVRCQHVGGYGVMLVVIGKDGKVVSVEPISGPDILRKSYVDAIKQWTYRPFVLNGQPVEVETTVTMNVALNGSACSSSSPKS